jgi:hypothetical protein
MRLIEFGGISYRLRAASSADVYISPDVLRFKRNDFHMAQEIAEAGYTAARASLTEWLARASQAQDQPGSEPAAPIGPAGVL